MGQASSNIDFHANVDASVGEGLTSIMSDVIEELSPDEFWALFLMDLRNRRRCLYEADELQAAWERLDESDLLVQDQHRHYLVWRVDRARDEAVCDNYGGDADLKRARWRSTLKVHRKPFLIEYWVVTCGYRDSGATLRALMARLLQTMNSRAGCTQDVPSLDGDGNLSVISDPIVDAVLSSDMFWRQTQDLIKKRAFKTLPDGSVVQKKDDGWADIWPGPSTYTRHLFLDERKEIISYTHSNLELGEASLEKVRHLRIHEKPYRLEMWTATPDRRRAGEEERAELLGLLAPVLEQASVLVGGEEQTDKSSEAAVAELYKLREEVGCLRSEVCSAMATLRQHTGGLEEPVPCVRSA